MDRDLARTPLAFPSEAPQAAEERAFLREQVRRREVREAETLIRGDDQRTLREQILLASTPAPPFLEYERGLVMARLLLESGSGEPWTDEVGNVMAWIGKPGPAPLVVSAHLDTVFPEDHPISIRQEGDRWIGPGICDDARGLAALLSLVRALDVPGAAPTYPVLAVASVGEEGAGDLRGVRHLFSSAGAGTGARGFISLDGAGLGRVISGGVGSRRFRARFTGPGGHSWVDWGRPNPIQALAGAMAAFERIELPAGTTINVGRVEGGTSVNAIPTSVTAECETRSEREDELDRVEAGMRAALGAALDRANDGVTVGLGLELAVETIGSRPAGCTAIGTDLVRAAVAATRTVAGSAELAASSTDANLPMSLGIPALTLGAGGEAGEAHTPNEWYRNENGPEGVLRAYLTLLALDRSGP